LKDLTKSSLESILSFFISIRFAKTPEEIDNYVNSLNESVFSKNDSKMLYCGENKKVKIKNKNGNMKCLDNSAAYVPLRMEDDAGCPQGCKKSNGLCLIPLKDGVEIGVVSEQVFDGVSPYVNDAICRSNSSDTAIKIRLTPREREVIIWASKGKGCWEIGEIVDISERTVKFHLQNIYKKLDVTNRAQAITRAIQYNLIEFE